MAYIAVDPYSQTALPKDVETWLATVRGKSAALTVDTFGFEGAVATQAMPVLDRWDVETHTYRKKLGGKIGILGKLFGIGGQKVTAGLVHEAKRYRLDKTEDGRVVEFGVSVRLAVATRNKKVEFSLTVPNFAAAAQLDMADARIGIYVIGFGGPLGDIIPAKEDLKVENYTKFIEAFSSVQKRVFGTEHNQYLSPTILGYVDDEEDGDE